MNDQTRIAITVRQASEGGWGATTTCEEGPTALIPASHTREKTEAAATEAAQRMVNFGPYPSARVAILVTTEAEETKNSKMEPRKLVDWVFRLAPSIVTLNEIK